MADTAHTHHLPTSWRAVRWRGGAPWRIGWTIATLCVTQVFVCAMALLPLVLLWWQILRSTESAPVLRTVAISVAAVPSYALFAMLLMLVSAVTTRAVGWRTPPDSELSIPEMGWPVLHWARYMVAIHVVRFFAGTLFRGSPIWTAYLRLAGARLGRRVYVNSLSLSDYNLLDFGDDVVIGERVHLSGHTVEGGLVKTGYVRLGRRVTIGLGSVVDIGADAGDDCQIGALSFVPKHARLEAGAVYAGIPVRRIG